MESEGKPEDPLYIPPVVEDSPTSSKANLQVSPGDSLENLHVDKGSSQLLGDSNSTKVHSHRRKSVQELMNLAVRKDSTMVDGKINRLKTYVSTVIRQRLRLITEVMDWFQERLLDEKYFTELYARSDVNEESSWEIDSNMEHFSIQCSCLPKNIHKMAELGLELLRWRRERLYKRRSSRRSEIPLDIQVNVVEAPVLQEYVSTWKQSVTIMFQVMSQSNRVPCADKAKLEQVLENGAALIGQLASLYETQLCKLNDHVDGKALCELKKKEYIQKLESTNARLLKETIDMKGQQEALTTLQTKLTGSQSDHHSLRRKVFSVEKKVSGSLSTSVIASLEDSDDKKELQVELEKYKEMLNLLCGEASVLKGIISMLEAKRAEGGKDGAEGVTPTSQEELDAMKEMLRKLSMDGPPAGPMSKPPKVPPPRKTSKGKKPKRHKVSRPSTFSSVGVEEKISPSHSDEGERTEIAVVHSTPPDETSAPAEILISKPSEAEFPTSLKCVSSTLSHHELLSVSKSKSGLLKKNSLLRPIYSVATAQGMDLSAMSSLVLGAPSSPSTETMLSVAGKLQKGKGVKSCTGHLKSHKLSVKGNLTDYFTSKKVLPTDVHGMKDESITISPGLVVRLNKENIRDTIVKIEKQFDKANVRKGGLQIGGSASKKIPGHQDLKGAKTFGGKGVFLGAGSNRPGKKDLTFEVASSRPSPKSGRETSSQEKLKAAEQKRIVPTKPETTNQNAHSHPQTEPETKEPGTHWLPTATIQSASDQDQTDRTSSDQNLSQNAEVGSSPGSTPDDVQSQNGTPDALESPESQPLPLEGDTGEKAPPLLDSAGGRDSPRDSFSAIDTVLIRKKESECGLVVGQSDNRVLLAQRHMEDLAQLEEAAEVSVRRFVTLRDATVTELEAHQLLDHAQAVRTLSSCDMMESQQIMDVAKLLDTNLVPNLVDFEYIVSNAIRELKQTYTSASKPSTEQQQLAEIKKTGPFGLPTGLEQWKTSNEKLKVKEEDFYSILGRFCSLWELYNRCRNELMYEEPPKKPLASITPIVEDAEGEEEEEEEEETKPTLFDAMPQSKSYHTGGPDESSGKASRDWKEELSFAKEAFEDGSIPYQDYMEQVYMCLKMAALLQLKIETLGNSYGEMRVKQVLSSRVRSMLGEVREGRGKLSVLQQRAGVSEYSNMMAGLDRMERIIRIEHEQIVVGLDMAEAHRNVRTRMKRRMCKTMDTIEESSEPSVSSSSLRLYASPAEESEEKMTAEHTDEKTTTLITDLTEEETKGITKDTETAEELSKMGMPTDEGLEEEGADVVVKSRTEVEKDEKGTETAAALQEEQEAIARVTNSEEDSSERGMRFDVVVTVKKGAGAMPASRVEDDVEQVEDSLPDSPTEEPAEFLSRVDSSSTDLIGKAVAASKSGSGVLMDWSDPPAYLSQQVSKRRLVPLKSLDSIGELLSSDEEDETPPGFRRTAGPSPSRQPHAPEAPLPVHVIQPEFHKGIALISPHLSRKIQKPPSTVQRKPSHRRSVRALTPDDSLKSHIQVSAYQPTKPKERKASLLPFFSGAGTSEVFEIAPGLTGANLGIDSVVACYPSLEKMNVCLNTKHLKTQIEEQKRQNQQRLKYTTGPLPPILRSSALPSSKSRQKKMGKHIISNLPDAGISDSLVSSGLDQTTPISPAFHYQAEKPALSLKKMLPSRLPDSPRVSTSSVVGMSSSSEHSLQSPENTMPPSLIPRPYQAAESYLSATNRTGQDYQTSLEDGISSLSIALKHSSDDVDTRSRHPSLTLGMIKDKAERVKSTSSLGTSKTLIDRDVKESARQTSISQLGRMRKHHQAAETLSMVSRPQMEKMLYHSAVRDMNKKLLMMDKMTMLPTLPSSNGAVDRVKEWVYHNTVCPPTPACKLTSKANRAKRLKRQKILIRHILNRRRIHKLAAQDQGRFGNAKEDDKQKKRAAACGGWPTPEVRRHVAFPAILESRLHCLDVDQTRLKASRLVRIVEPKHLLDSACHHIWNKFDTVRCRPR